MYYSQGSAGLDPCSGMNQKHSQVFHVQEFKTVITSRGSRERPRGHGQGPVEIGHKKMAAKIGHKDFMFLGLPKR